MYIYNTRIGTDYSINPGYPLTSTNIDTNNYDKYYNGNPPIDIDSVSVEKNLSFNYNTLENKWKITNIEAILASL